MANPDSPVKMPEFHLIPEADRGIDLDKGIKQVLALLTAYYREKQVALSASNSGMLWVGSPELADIIVFVATSEVKAWQGDNIACTEVAVIAGLSNGDRIWTRPNKVATTLNAWPLDKSEIFGFTLHNLNQLHVTIQTADDIAIIAYTE